MSEPTTRNAVFAVIGGGLWILVPGVSVVSSQWVTAIIGILATVGILYGLLELRFEYDETLGTYGRTGCLLSGIGLVGGFVAALLAAVYLQANVVVTFLAGLSLAGGGVLLVVGSVVLAFGLWNHRLLSEGPTLLLGLGLPVGLLVTAALPVSLLFGTVLYGLAWVVIGIRLRRGLLGGDGRGTAPRVLVPSPPRLAALLVGAILTGLGLVGVLPSGPLTAEPLAGQSRLLDGGHLVVGISGVVVSLVGTGPSRSYGKIAGGLLVGLIGAWIVPPVRIVLGLTLVSVFVHIPLGLVLFVITVAERWLPTQEEASTVN